MKKVIWYFLFLFALMPLSSCSELEDLFNDEDDEEENVDDGDEESEVNGVMWDILISGHVMDLNGEAVSGVRVTSGDNTAVTDGEGFFCLDRVDVVSGRSVVRFSKDGYFDVVRSLNSIGADDWDVVICRKAGSEISTSVSYSASEAHNLQAGGMKIEMPKNGYVVDETGKEFTGSVNADMVYLSPENECFQEMMPGGDLSAQRTDGSSTMLLSYGMTAVNLTDNNGNKLQLKEGSEATLTFPIPVSMKDNLPASIPLWSFNEKTGLWEEEGLAELKGDVYVGKVKHFSWVNLDEPSDTAWVEGRVTNTKGYAIPNQIVTVGQFNVRTDANGFYRTIVQSGVDFEISVKPQYYGRYKNIFSLPVKALSSKETRTVNITLPYLSRIFGRIVNMSGGSCVASVWLKYGSKTTTSVSSGADGGFSFYGPENYSGNATVCVRTIEGTLYERDIVLSDNDYNVGDIVISSTAGEGGILSVSMLNGEQTQMIIPANMDDIGGVMIVDDKFIYSYGDDYDGNSSARFVVDGYDDTKHAYDNGSLQLMYNGTEVVESSNKTSFTISASGDAYIVDISGRGCYYNMNKGVYGDSCTFSASAVGLPFFFQGTTTRNADPAKLGFPSFTPKLSSPAPFAFVIKKSRSLGKGGMLYYNGTKADFDNLKKQADKMGLSLIESDVDETYADVTYYSGKKLVMISFDSECAPISDDFNPFENDAQLSVMVLDGVESLDIFMSGEAKSMRKMFGRKK